MSNLIIKEKIDPNIKKALFGNFSNSIQAIREIIDNSVSHRLSGQTLKIEIFFLKKKIEIRDRGGSGMTIEDLKFFFNWGGAKKRTYYDIGLYSQGGKAAIGFLGNSFVIITSPIGKMEAYRIEDWNLRDTKKLKKYSVMSIPADSEKGYTSIEIGDLRASINKNILKEILIDTYRPLLETKAIEIFIDGEEIKLASLPIDKDFKKDKISFTVLKNKKVLGWIGRLAPKSGVKGGMRCYYKGRLICDREFFGHPDPTSKMTLNFLFGEVYLDFVSVNTNKTDFQRNSEDWLVVDKEMHQKLKPHIDELLGREIEEPTEEEIKRVKTARDLYNEILKLIKKEEKGLLSEMGTQGQKPPELLLQPHSSHILGRKRGKYNPATPPPLNAIGRRKRLRQFMDWNIRSMGEQIRSKIEQTKEGKLLVINNKFPGFIINKGHINYLLETAALQTTKPLEEDRLTPKEYLEAFDEHFYQICTYLEQAKEIMKKKRK